MLDGPTRSLVRLAAVIAHGSPELVQRECRAALDARIPPIWVDELLLQSVLMVGYPRALSAAKAWRDVSAQPVHSLEDGTDLGQAESWRVRGEATCHTIYGANYAKLRINVASLHPALDAWMVQEGYGRTLGRPGLDLLRRELAVVAQVLVLGPGAERQLHSHLRGSLNAGATQAEVQEALDLAKSLVDRSVADAAQELWERIIR